MPIGFSPKDDSPFDDALSLRTNREAFQSILRIAEFDSREAQTASEREPSADSHERATQARREWARLRALARFVIHGQVDGEV